MTEPEFIDPTLNPAKSQAEIDAIFSQPTEFPSIDLPPDDLVTLPGGFMHKGKLIKIATVRELTGEDEEALARVVSAQPLNPFHFIDRLIKRGTVRIGDAPPEETENLLPQLLIGDREYLILGIRKATYGNDIEIENWKCPLCGDESTLMMTLDDIPVTKLPNSAEDIEFDVKLRKGVVARVRLANGEDQVAIFEKENLTQAERETVLLSRCVIKLTQPDGTELHFDAFPSMAQKLGVSDRHKILARLRDGQPGPKYDEIKYKCGACGEGVNVSVGLGDLFLDFRWV